MRQLISSGSTFERDVAYSRAVVDGDFIFVAGTTGFDYAAMTLPDGILEQTEQCFRNIQAALEKAGASLADVVRVTYIVPRAADFQQCWPVLRQYFGDVRRRDDDLGGPAGSADADRDRSDGAEGPGLSPTSDVRSPASIPTPLSMTARDRGGTPTVLVRIAPALRPT
jgi:enamine deaminase RidA (YjgF/YER057c/UK114 family)